MRLFRTTPFALVLIACIMLVTYASPSPPPVHLSIHQVRQTTQNLYLPMMNRANATSLVSVALTGLSGNGSSLSPDLSANGRYIAFESRADDLVVGDTNNRGDIFVYDWQTKQMSRVSVASDGTQSNGDSYTPAITPDGRYVAFYSTATNLATSTSIGSRNVYLHDRQTGITSHITWLSGSDHYYGGGNVALSADGRFVAFESLMTNLVPGDTNYAVDIFVHDRLAGITTRVSVSSSGVEGNTHSFYPTLSTDGRYVTFVSASYSLVTGDTNNTFDVFVHDRQTGETERVSVASDGTQANENSPDAALSADGKMVAFCSLASNLVAGDDNNANDLFVHDRQTGETYRAAAVVENDSIYADCEDPALSADGRYVAFVSGANNFVPGDTNQSSDVFVYDHQTNNIRRVSVAGNGAQGDRMSDRPSLSADGLVTAFRSFATNLDNRDMNGLGDIFLSGYR